MILTKVESTPPAPGVSECEGSKCCDPACLIGYTFLPPHSLASDNSGTYLKGPAGDVEEREPKKGKNGIDRSL